MRRAAKSCATAVVLSFLSVSCATLQEHPKAAQGTVFGAVGGAAAGSAIGAIVGGGRGAGQGAAIGAVVGALGGTLVGSYLDNQAKEMQSVLSEQDRIREEQGRLQVVMDSDVLFESGKANLYPGGLDKLRQLAGVLNRYPRTNITIVGHTDSVGSEQMNQDLSLRRAQAVADELIRDGVSSSRIAVRGEGETRPVASNSTAGGRAQNRRVEINVTPDQGLQAEDRGAPPPEQPGGYPSEPH